MDERFEALPFDAEAPEDKDLPAEWMFIPLAGMVGVIGWNVFAQGWRPWDFDFLAMTALLSFWVWMYWFIKRHEHDDTSRYVVIHSDGIEVHAPGWYETFVPFAKISRVVDEPSYGLKSMIAESFSWYGRVPERGRHVAIYCNARVPAPIPGALIPGRFWRRNFRVKLRDPERFIKQADAALAEWRREHGLFVELPIPV